MHEILLINIKNSPHFKYILNRENVPYKYDKCGYETIQLTGYESSLLGKNCWNETAVVSKRMGFGSSGVKTPFLRSDVTVASFIRLFMTKKKFSFPRFMQESE